MGKKKAIFLIISQKFDFVAEFPKKRFLGDSNEGKCLKIFEESAGCVSENDKKL